jgi:protein-tyrosine kinase
MEKIQQAMEKARAQRQAARPPAEPLVIAPAAAAPAAPSGHGGDPFAVDWQRIRSVALPRAVQDRCRLVAGAPGRASDAFRMLRTRALELLDARQGRALAVVSANQGDGKTVVAANLAISVARHLHRKALLVDLDVRRPSVAACFGLADAPSLSDYLEGGAVLTDCLVSPGIDRLALLPQARAVEHSSELLASPRMATLARELRARDPERLIIYDCPPLLTTDDALIALGYADGCLVVVREGRTARSELQRAVELIGEERVLGTVLNAAVWSYASRYAGYAADAA